MNKERAGKSTILAIDDEENNLRILQFHLEKEGYKVITAGDGVEGLKVLKHGFKNIDLILLDRMMPNMDGVETLRELRRIQQDVKVVLSSGYHEQDVTERLAGEDFAGFLKKPYTENTLIGELRQALEGDG